MGYLFDLHQPNYPLALLDDVLSNLPPNLYRTANETSAGDEARSTLLIFQHDGGVSTIQTNSPNLDQNVMGWNVGGRRYVRAEGEWSWHFVSDMTGGSTALSPGLEPGRKSLRKRTGEASGTDACFGCPLDDFDGCHCGSSQPIAGEINLVQVFNFEFLPNFSPAVQQEAVPGGSGVSRVSRGQNVSPR